MPEITIKISMQEDNCVSVKQTNSSTNVTSDTFNIEPPNLDQYSNDFDESVPAPIAYEADLDYESDVPSPPEDKQVSIDWSSSILELPDGDVESIDYEIDLPPVPEVE